MKSILHSTLFIKLHKLTFFVLLLLNTDLVFGQSPPEIYDLYHCEGDTFDVVRNEDIGAKTRSVCSKPKGCLGIPLSCEIYYDGFTYHGGNFVGTEGKERYDEFSNCMIYRVSYLRYVAKEDAQITVTIKSRYEYEANPECPQCIPGVQEPTRIRIFNLHVYKRNITPRLTATSAPGPTLGTYDVTLTATGCESYDVVRWKVSGQPYSYTFTGGNSTTMRIDDPYECVTYTASCAFRFCPKYEPRWSNSIQTADYYKDAESNPGYSQKFADYLARRTSQSYQKPEYWYRRQFQCLQQTAAAEYQRSGINGWAGDFVGDIFNSIATDNPCQISPDATCESNTPIFCMYGIGDYHVKKELTPAFYRYGALGRSNINKWNADHEAFLANAVGPCLDQLFNIYFIQSWCGYGPLACVGAAVARYSLEFSIKRRVRKLREEAQAIRMHVFTSTLASNELQPVAESSLVLPAPFTKGELFSADIDTVSKLRISADTAYWLKPGRIVQLSVKYTNSQGAIIDYTRANTGTAYQLNVDPSVATISPDGLLTIRSYTEVLVNSRVPLHIYAKNGELEGVGQFALYGQDSDNDLLTDGYETSVGLNPMIANDERSDLDGDDIIDRFEACYGTSPRVVDTDGDGYNDAVELIKGTNALLATSHPNNRVIRSAKSGDWLATATWECNCVPTEADEVVIRSNHQIDLFQRVTTKGVIYISAGKINLRNSAARIQLKR